MVVAEDDSVVVAEDDSVVVAEDDSVVVAVVEQQEEIMLVVVVDVDVF